MIKSKWESTGFLFPIICVRGGHFKRAPVWASLGERLVQHVWIFPSPQVTLPDLETLTFGDCFNQSLERVQLPRSLQALSLGFCFTQALEGVDLPGDLKHLSLGYKFNRSLEQVNLPPALQSLTFGFHFKQSLELVTLPSNLQTLTFGDEFNQSMEQVTCLLTFFCSKKHPEISLVICVVW